jgi:hypothetical protein
MAKTTSARPGTTSSASSLRLRSGSTNRRRLSASAVAARPTRTTQRSLARRTHAGLLAVEPPEAIALRPEANLRLAVGYYREGLNAGSPFYRFLAFWNCLDATFSVETDSTPRDDFIRREAPRLAWRWDNARYPFPANPAADLARDSRHAVAHVLRPAGRRTIDPDLADDRARLDLEASLLKWLARSAIEQEYPHPVSVARRWN